jgi:hypothetical protein
MQFSRSLLKNILANTLNPSWRAQHAAPLHENVGDCSNHRLLQRTAFKFQGLCAMFANVFRSDGHGLQNDRRSADGLDRNWQY